jgi:hypothetical protein
VYSAAEEPKIMITGKWNKSLSCQPCDQEGDPLPGTELKEVVLSFTYLRMTDALNWSYLIDCRSGELLLPHRATSISTHNLHTK